MHARMAPSHAARALHTTSNAAELPRTQDSTVQQFNNPSTGVINPAIHWLSVRALDGWFAPRTFDPEIVVGRLKCGLLNLAEDARILHPQQNGKR